MAGTMRGNSTSLIDGVNAVQPRISAAMIVIS